MGGASKILNIIDVVPNIESNIHSEPIYPPYIQSQYRYLIPMYTIKRSMDLVYNSADDITQKATKVVIKMSEDFKKIPSDLFDQVQITLSSSMHGRLTKQINKLESYIEQIKSLQMSQLAQFRIDLLQTMRDMIRTTKQNFIQIRNIYGMNSVETFEAFDKKLNKLAMIKRYGNYILNNCFQFFKFWEEFEDMLILKSTLKKHKRFPKEWDTWNVIEQNPFSVDPIETSTSQPQSKV